MCSNKKYSAEEQNILLALARTAIEHGLAMQQELTLDLFSYSEKLRQVRASFVTLLLDNDLRGCIGSLEATRPLVSDINHNAYAAAFRDPRFSPLSQQAFKNVELSISILTPSEPMVFASEDDLLSQIQIGIDGLILSDGHHQATFLPSVWQTLPDKKDFLNHLKQKAGLKKDHWSANISIARYKTFSF